MSFFVDTSAFYAAAVPDDPAHERSMLVLGGADSGHFTTDAVLIELWALMTRRKGRHVAERLLGMLVSGPLRPEPVGRGDLLRAMEIEEEFPDQGFSLVDRTSFAVMHRLGLNRVATFDRHFAIYRFGPGRRKAFEIAR